MRTRIDEILEEFEKGSTFESIEPTRTSGGAKHMVPVFSSVWNTATIKQMLATFVAGFSNRDVVVEISKQDPADIHYSIVAFVYVPNVHWPNTVRHCEARRVPYVQDEFGWINIPPGATACTVPCVRLGRGQFGMVPADCQAIPSNALHHQDMHYRAALLPLGLTVPGDPEMQLTSKSPKYPA